LRPGAVAVGALVLLRECLFQQRDQADIDRPVGNPHHELIRLSLVVQRRRALDRRAGAQKTLGCELLSRLLRQCTPRRADLAEVGTTTRSIPSADAILAANSGPLPPKANSANSRGSRPRSVETALMARIMLDAAIWQAP